MDLDSIQRRVFGAHQSAYVWTDGRIGHRLVGVPTLLLRTTGRRTGAERVSTLVYGRDGDAFVVVASNGGAEREPAWLLNIREDPRVSIQVARQRMDATARVVDVSDPAYGRLWALVNRVNHDRYTAYQAKTDRPIALVALTPVKHPG